MYVSLYLVSIRNTYIYWKGSKGSFWNSKVNLKLLFHSIFPTTGTFHLHTGGGQFKPSGFNNWIRQIHKSSIKESSSVVLYPFREL